MNPAKDAKRRDTSHGFGRGNAIVRWGICILGRKCRIPAGQSASRTRNSPLQPGGRQVGTENASSNLEDDKFAQKKLPPMWRTTSRHWNCFLQTGAANFVSEMQISHRTALLPLDNQPFSFAIRSENPNESSRRSVPDPTIPLGHRPKTQAIVLKKKYICIRLSHTAFCFIRVKKNFLHNT